MEIVIDGVTAKAFLNIIGVLKNNVTGYYYDGEKGLYTVYLTSKKKWYISTYDFVTTLRPADYSNAVELRSRDYVNIIIN